MRNQRSASLWSKGVYYVISSAASGALMGLATAGLGIAVFREMSDIGVALAVGLASAVGVYMGTKELAGGRVRLWQINIETPQRWMHLGPVLWPLANGSALGLTITSRIGFPIAYAIPAIVIASQSLLIGGVVWGTYSAVRASLALPLGMLIRRAADPDQASLRMVAAIPRLRKSTGCVLVALSAFGWLQLVLA